MIDARDLYEKMLLLGLSLTAATNKHPTANVLQQTLLRCMGAKVAGPVSFDRRPLIRLPRNLELGRYVSIGANAQFTCWAPVSIGDDFLASDDLTINTSSHNIGTFQPNRSPIRIGNRVWCGTRVTICSGVTIGDDAVIGAGAVVVRSVDPNMVVAGVPARPLRTIERDPALLWSNWPQRNHFHPYHRSTSFKKFLLRLRNSL